MNFPKQIWDADSFVLTSLFDSNIAFYTIYVGSTSPDLFVFHALLPNKKLETYISSLTILLQSMSLKIG
ncbi:hypothetical protein HZS_5039 [Henneguya salminicola]|nr:hypothetical protein HZS_5039 [Henneguya salminicola]